MWVAATPSGCVAPRPLAALLLLGGSLWLSLPSLMYLSKRLVESQGREFASSRARQECGQDSPLGREFASSRTRRAWVRQVMTQWCQETGCILCVKTCILGDFVV